MLPTCPSCGSRIISQKACHSCGNNFHKGGKKSGGGGTKEITPGGGMPKPGQAAGAVIQGGSLSSGLKPAVAHQRLVAHGYPGDGGVAINNHPGESGRFVVGSRSLNPQQLSKVVKSAGGVVVNAKDVTDWRGNRTSTSVYFNMKA